MTLLPPTSVSRQGSNHNLTTCLSPSFWQHRSRGRSSHRPQGAMGRAGSAPGPLCCTTALRWHDSGTICLPHQAGAATMAPASQLQMLPRPARCQVSYLPVLCLHSGKRWHSLVAREPCVGNSITLLPLPPHREEVAGGVSAQGLGLREETLVPGRHQALAELHQAPPATGRWRRAPLANTETQSEVACPSCGGQRGRWP